MSDPQLVWARLRVRDVARSRRFYEAALGRLGFTAVEAPNGTVAVGRGTPLLWLVPAGDAPVGGATLAVSAPEPQDVEAAYRAAGRGSVALTPPRNLSAFLDDPDGNVLEVVSGLTPAELAARALVARVPGARIGASAGSLRIETPDRVLVTISDEDPAWVRVRAPERDGDRTAEVRTTADLAALQPIAAAAAWWSGRLTVHTLRKGVRYRVDRTFTDHAGQVLAAGRELVFVGSDFLPYHDGWTLHFEGQDLWLDGAGPIIEDLDLHLVPV